VLVSTTITFHVSRITPLLTENIRLGLRSLAANKLRAALTMLGITIGVAAVITLVSVGAAVSRYVADQFSALGTNVLYIFPGQFQRGGPPARTANTYLTDRDVQALSDPARVPDAGFVVPVIRRGVKASFGGQQVEVGLRATTATYFEAREYKAFAGRFFTTQELEEQARVVVLGQTTLNRLFAPDVEPIGATLRINGQPFRVIGVYEKRGATPFGDEDDAVFAPYTTATRALFTNRTPKGDIALTLLLVQYGDADRKDALITQITDALRETRNIPYRGEDDFTILSGQDLISAFQSITAVLTLFLGAIASISLLVGGIGIMNIMLVSVTERTKEIGLRKAVGAKRRHVLTQFLLEAVILSLMGGMIGVALGAVGIVIIARFVPDLAPSVTVDSVALSTTFSIAVGLFFGIYPAIRASGLSPIEALRYE
jgi:putative ABC transport system permease protein